MLLCAASGLNALFFAISAYRRRLFESGPLLASVVWLCLAGGYSLISRTTGQLPRMTIFGHYPSDFVLLIWMIVVKYGLIARYVRIKNGMQELSGRLLSAQEEERKRLSRDLHDSMGQNLAAVKFNLQRINKEMKNERIDGVIDEISGSIKELRDITSGLMPVSLQAIGLKKTLEAYAGKLSAKTGMGIYVDADEVPRLAEETELNLFRFFQEAVSNAAKHSGASKVNVSLRHKPPRIVLEIRDNGCGFDYRQSQSVRSGMGLSIMAERMKMLGGNMEVASLRDSGTTVRAEAPV